MAGLLTFFILKSLPIPDDWNSGQSVIQDLVKITAAGTVRDFHPVPYYPVIRREHRNHR